MEKKFTWIPFYRELAKKLLEFKNNRSDLVKIVYELDEKYVNFINNHDKSQVFDIDFFSFFSIFNRGLTNENRKIICGFLKNKLNLSAEIPSDFDSIPLVDNRKSTFYRRETADNQIPLLCSLFEAVFNDDLPLVEKIFDKVLDFNGIKWNITMGFYWISPYNFMPLDSNSRSYLKKNGINVFDEKELNGKNYLNLLEEIKNCIQIGKLKEKSIPEISYNAWTNPGNSNGGSIMPDNYLADNLTELLKHTHNLILHGAPGTVKTFLAKEIAKRMGCSQNEIGFVQFHPSYDYTDFVEGLRPKNQSSGEIGFERKDGVFKEFCKRALFFGSENIKNFLKKAKQTSHVFSTKDYDLRSLYNFSIDSFSIENDEIKISSKGESKDFQNEIRVSDLQSLFFTDKKITSLDDIKVLGLTGETCPEVYYFCLYKELQKMQKPFIFIIDEINRGELSKIFGELFFCIDPGYRGKKGLIKTQYQNLIENDDEFYDGFFIPENVYIIGTMNDIDRSVDTMDFAFRRRFAFKEIKASENLGMFDELGEIADEAKTRLTKLNEEISKITELSSPSSYHIGGAYFLKLNDFEGDCNERFQKLWGLSS